MADKKLSLPCTHSQTEIARGPSSTERVAIYARVSTDKQETENQLAQLREFAAKQGWSIAYRERA